MTIKIGFQDTSNDTVSVSDVPQAAAPVVAAPKKSVVTVQFPNHDTPLTYYNDRFDLHSGDRVFVEGSMAGIRGEVCQVSYGFKIRSSDYKRVIAAPDTHVNGQFFLTGSHLVSFDPTAIPAEKIAGWFLPPQKEDEILQGYHDETIDLHRLNHMDMEDSEGEKGQDIYWHNQVLYLCLNEDTGYAIVEDESIYEVEFEYRDSDVRNLTCSCFCCGNCRHGVAALKQLRETLGYIEEYYAGQYQESGYFAAIYKGAFIPPTINRRNVGEIRLSL